jgi:uncharacterized membrane protein YeaQ/YmgE (transglycosylase-associated protein family)
MEFGISAQYWVNLVLLWIGFGAVAGLIVKIILPDGEPKGFFSVLLTGMLGSFAGPLIVSIVRKSDSFQPISPLGFLASILATAVLFLFLRFFLFLFRKSDTIHGVITPVQTEQKTAASPAVNK